MFGLRTAIYRHVDPLKLLSHLKSKDVLKQKEFDAINETSVTSCQKIAYIIEAVTCKGESGLDHFIAALKKETDHLPHQALAEILEGVRNGFCTPLSPEFTLMEDVISPHLPAFIHCVNLRVLLPKLIKYQIIAGDKVKYFSNFNLTTARLNCHLFCKLYRCGSDAVEKFIYCLIEENTHPPHHDLAWQLIQQLSTLERHRVLVNRLEKTLRDTPWVSCIYHMPAI